MRQLNPAQELIDNAVLRTSHVAHDASLLVNMFVNYCCARRLKLPKVDTKLYSTACRLVSDCGVEIKRLGKEQPELLAFYNEHFAQLQRARPQSHGLQSVMTSTAIEMSKDAANMIVYGTKQHQARRGGRPCGSLPKRHHTFGAHRVVGAGPSAGQSVCDTAASPSAA